MEFDWFLSPAFCKSILHGGILNPNTLVLPQNPGGNFCVTACGYFRGKDHLSNDLDHWVPATCLGQQVSEVDTSLQGA
jgi:hypothetical protein